LYTESNHNVSETDIVEGCKLGDRKMQEMLYYKYSPKMYSICLRYCGNAEDAQDLLQDGFMKVYANIEKFRGDGSFEGWVRRIFVNTSIEHFRRNLKISVIPEGQEYNIVDNDWNGFDAMAEKDILSLIQELSPGYKQVFNMYVIEGYSHKEISELLEISEGTSKSQLARAKAILKNIIETKPSTK
jgi:RNA polymerase sigma factor (sigma-70 family)